MNRRHVNAKKPTDIGKLTEKELKVYRVNKSCTREDQIMMFTSRVLQASSNFGEMVLVMWLCGQKQQRCNLKISY